MDVFDFLPTYIDFDKDTESILGPELIDKTSLYYKKEFHDYKLSQIEERPDEAGQYMNHQIIMARFLSSYTPYKGIMVMHEPGTGKTCLSVAVIEKIKEESSIFRGALILMKGKNLINNYKKELVEKCTSGKYDIDEDDELTQNKKKRRINKKLSSFYKFQTFETFSKLLSKMSDEEIKRQYSNIIIVIDEAHHLRITNDNGDIEELKGQYNNIFRLLHTVENCKTILMTGTPMIDSPSEIASLMNLLLDEKDQLPTGDDFEKEYMKNEKGVWTIDESKSDILKERLYGKVSFLRSMQSSIKREFVGEKLDLLYFNQYALSLKDFQLNVYQKALQEDREMKGIYINSRESSLFVFPDGTYGRKGFEHYTTIVKDKFTDKLKLRIKSSLTEPFLNKTIDEKLKVLSNYSIKYASCIKLLLENEGNHFVYMDFVQGSGAIIFSELLKQFGFEDFKLGGSGNKFALLTSKTSSDIDKAISIFNSESNVNGKRIKVIIGTKIISEGFTLKNVRHVHILTPHWNFSETDQAIARAFRLFSHNDIEKIIPNLIVKIYLYTIITNTDDLSIDRYMYKFCEDKDIAIKSVEHLLKQISFDCNLMKERNILQKTLDYTRNCEYEKCDYECYEDSNQNRDIDYSTFNLFYDQNEIEKWIIIIKALFIKKSLYTIKELVGLLKDINYYFLLKVILYMVEHKITINDKKGIPLFLYYDQDLVYTSKKICNTEWFDHFYVDNNPLQLEFNFNKQINKLYDHYLSILFEKMKMENDKNREKILTKFNEQAKELLIEYSILSKEKEFLDVHPIREYLMDHFSTFVFKKDKMIVSTLLGKEHFRCLDLDKEWKDCPKDIKPDIEVKKSEYPYDGFYENGIFKIKEQQSVVHEDGRKTTKGVNCVLSIKKPKLLMIIHTLKIEPDKKNTFENKNSETLKALINKKDDLKEFQKLDLTDKDMIRLLYWEQFNKEPICKIIEIFFKEKAK